MPIQQMFLGSGAAPDKYWYLLFGNSSYDLDYRDLRLDSSDNIYAVGYAKGISSSSNFDGVETKYDKDGSLVWEKASSRNSYNNYWYSCNLDSSTNLYMYGFGNYKAAFGKKSGGNQVLSYASTYNSSQSQVFASAQNGNTMYVVGQNTTLDEAWIFSHNSSYGIYDSRKFERSGNERMYMRGAAVDSSNNVIAVGKGEDFPHPAGGGVDTNMALIIKFNSGCTEQWSRTIGGSGNSEFVGVGTDSSDNIYCFGVDGTGGQKCLMVKYNSSGTIQWQRTLGSPCTGGTQSSITDSSGNSYVCGKQANQHAWIAKINSSGGTEWCRTWESSGGSDEQELHGIEFDSKGNLIIVGHHRTTKKIGLVMKLPNDGSLTGTHGAFTYAAVSPSNSTTSIGNVTNVGLSFSSISISFSSLNLAGDSTGWSRSLIDID